MSIFKCALSVVFLLNVAACTSVPKANPVVLEPVQETVVIPPELLADCVAMKPLTLDSYTELQVLQQVQLWSTDAATCRIHHKALADIARRAFNINTNKAKPQQ